MKTLILDYSKWRCGGDKTIGGLYPLGDGHTLLLNSAGFMCCLGQFSLQINEKLSERHILGYGDPSETGYEINNLTYRPTEEDNGIYNSALSNEAVDINDRLTTTPEEKIVLLKELFYKHGYEIEVINNPENLTNA